MLTTWSNSVQAANPRAKAEKQADRSEPGRDQLAIMLKIDNMLEKQASWEHKEKNIERQFEMLANAHAEWARATVLWESLEPKRGVWKWEAADKVIACAKRHHVNLLWIVGGTALWDSSNGDWDGTPKDLNIPDGVFPQYVHQLVKRYKSDVEYWEIRNEPNLDKMSVEQYATYLTQAARAIRHEAPNAHVVCGGMGGKLQNQLGYFNKLVLILQQKDRDLPFEIANFHVYPYHSSDNGFKGPDSVLHYTQHCNEMIEKTMKQRGLETMPVWITEIDYPAAPKHQADDPDYHHGAPSQARFVKDIFPELARGHPERKLFYASLIDDFDSGEEFKSTGLIQSDKEYRVLEPKKAYETFKEILSGR